MLFQLQFVSFCRVLPAETLLAITTGTIETRSLEVIAVRCSLLFTTLVNRYFRLVWIERSQN